MAGDNNHLLYFIDVYFWTKALALVGMKADSAFGFVRMTQWMNALAGIIWVICDGGVAGMGRHLVADQPTAAAGENGGPFDKACPVLLPCWREV
jgi:hypothetical protein